MQTNGALNLEQCVPKKRKQFGKYRFVEVDPNPTIPIFLCCPYHNGDGNVPQQGTNDIKNVHQQPPLPTNFNSNFVNSNQADALPKPLPPPQISNGDSFYDDDDFMNMDVDIISPNEKHASALFGFPEVPEQLSRSESNDIQILDVLPSTSKPLAAATKPPTVRTIDDDDDGFDNDAEFLAAFDSAITPINNGAIKDSGPSNDIQPYYVGMGPRHDMHGKFKTYLKDDGNEFMDSGKHFSFAFIPFKVAKTCVIIF